MIFMVGASMLNRFINIVRKSDEQKYCKKSMFLSFIKYQIFLFAFVFCTYKIFAFYMIPAWIVFLVISRFYIKIWKYQGYSVLFLIGSSAAIICLTILISPIIRMVLWNLIVGGV